MQNVDDLLLEQTPVVVNIGFREFGEALLGQGVRVIQVDWQPPAAGDEELTSLLDELL